MADVTKNRNQHLAELGTGPWRQIFAQSREAVMALQRVKATDLTWEESEEIRPEFANKGQSALLIRETALEALLLDVKNRKRLAA